ncbi:glutathionylspermidine synthase family protein [Breznakiella homolactica]|uniref:Glutathionylspermidine synthase family protein n=1 Tax=Breznakiella homolactica TaxID=2798577 RepID=A0A7T8B7R7_9SPIR|nr:glutathionylspermidine synthase family protein [Breznakiella homolactica]QQO07804.1 glutathionylspermidine synthase family protein [Breznakiella homolactica]
MHHGIKLAVIPDETYSEYRYETIFKAYKWDPQVEDHNTVSRYVILMNRETAHQLEQWAEKLSEETMLMEEAFLKDFSPAKELGLPKQIIRALPRLTGYKREEHVRLMRFDFHPTETGWAISEVNSDVPGGFAEASVLPEIAGRYFDGYGPHRNIAQSLFEAYRSRIKPGGRVAFVHATSYSDDRQVMQFIGDYFASRGMETLFAAPDHIRWKERKALSIAEGQDGPVDGLVRFFPLEWLPNLPKNSDWKGYYDCETPSCNHPIAVFAQSKRLPLVWDSLGTDNAAWKELLPPTKDPRFLREQDAGWILKPALGRVGEGISIPEAVGEKELRQIAKAARREPRNWVAQERFRSQALPGGGGGSFHLCVGLFTVNGKSAGFYGRISPYPRIDDKARDIPILVAQGE